MNRNSSVWFVCIVLLLALLAGCTAAAGPETAAPQPQTSPADSKPGPHETPAPPAQSTPAQPESTPSSMDSTLMPDESATAPSESASDPNGSAPDPAAEEAMYLLVNGTRLALGMQYADVMEAIGERTAPDDALGAGDGAGFGTIHVYPDLTVTENGDGVVFGLERKSVFAGEGDAALLGKIRLGTPLDEALAVLGSPDNEASVENDGMLIYERDGQYICVFLDMESKSTVSGVSMTLS